MSNASIAALRESGRRFRTALANSPIVVFEQDLDLRYTWIHDAKLGDKVQDFIGKTDADMMDASWAARLTAIKRGVIETGQVARLEAPAGPRGGPTHVFDLIIEPRRDDAGQTIGVICTATDIAAHKREQPSRQSEERFLLLFEQAVDGIFLSDATGHYLDVNTAGHKMLGYTRDEILSRTFVDLLAPRR
jgi:PAS domain-containing protein